MIELDEAVLDFVAPFELIAHTLPVFSVNAQEFAQGFLFEQVQVILVFGPLQEKLVGDFDHYACSCLLFVAVKKAHQKV